jgi:hypothetical protein
MLTLRARLAGGGAAVAITAATAVLTAGASPAQAAPSPTTTTTACVGLVVDSGASPVTTDCPAFSAGLTGQQLLVAAGHKLTFDKNGFICQIDGYPDTCGSDNTHYWAYYHRAPGAADTKWAFSQKGANVYVVHPGETEGWAYQNGTQREPKAVPYASLQAGAKAAADHNTAVKVAKSDSNGPPVTVILVAVVVVVLLGGTALRIARGRRTE